MDYSKRYNELLTELKQLITEHNDEIFVSTAYNFISMNDNDGIAQAGSGSTEDQLAMLMVHMVLYTLKVLRERKTREILIQSQSV